MDDSISFRVYGIPTPKGSFTKMPNGAMLPAGTAKSRKAKAQWEQAVSDAGKEAMNDRKLCVRAIRLLVEYRMPVPKTMAKDKWGWYPHISYPDLDKLDRALRDALTGVVWADDAQVAYATSNKGYSWEGQPGAFVVIDFMSEYALREIATSQRAVLDVMETL